MLRMSKYLEYEMRCTIPLQCTGDPRICLANIIWVNPDTTTWIRNPCESRNGELALDIVLEKSVVKQSGDAWRIVLDSCLPVLHLIDTRRSIPYAIKQLQEMLGVSCAFDQAVQVSWTYLSLYVLLAPSMHTAEHSVFPLDEGTFILGLK